MNQPSSEQMSNPTRVFLSYSRQDGEFLQLLAKRLEQRGYLVDFDLTERDPTNQEIGISAQEEWWVRLKEMISTADVVLFIVSPVSASSRVCDDELAHARNLGKRVVPVICRPIDFDTAPERLRALNMKLDFQRGGTAGFEQVFERLCVELDLDISWHRRATHIARLAHQWDAEGRAEGNLLREGAITDAEAWAARRPRDAPEPGPLVLDFLEASRRKEEHDRALLELSELDARLQAADALIERALLHKGQAEFHAALEHLMRAAEIAPPTAIPARFRPTLEAEGWARAAWTAAASLCAGMPERVSAYEVSIEGSGTLHPWPSCVWFDRGNHAAVTYSGQITIFRFEGDGSLSTWGIDTGNAIVATSGARGAPRLAVLQEDETLRCIDLDEGRMYTVPLYRHHDEEADAAKTVIAVSPLGDQLVVARSAPSGNHGVAEIRDWEPGSVGEPRLFARLAHDQVNWAGFAQDGKAVGISTRGHLEVFDREGSKLRESKGGTAVAPDLTIAAHKQYDLVELHLQLDPEDRTGAAGPIVLEGARSLVSDIQFLCDSSTLLARSGFRMVEWRRPAALTRGITFENVRFTSSFGSKNHVGPSDHLDGLPSSVAFAPHPEDPSSILIVTETGLEHWRLHDRAGPLEEIDLAPAARAVFGPDAGWMAVASARGVWAGESPASDGTSFARYGPAALANDVALSDRLLAAAYQKNVVCVFNLVTGEEMHIPVDDEPSALCFSSDSDRLYIGLQNGVLWEWSASEKLTRIGALGIGPIRRLRVSAEGGVGVAVGVSSDDPYEEDAHFHSGVAIWDLDERHVRWRIDHSGLPIGSPNDADVSPDGKFLVVAGILAAIALDVGTGEVLARFLPPQKDPSKPGHITAACIGPDGRTAYLGLWDGSIVHVDILSRRILDHWKAHDKYVSSIDCDLASGIIVSTSPLGEGLDAGDTKRVKIWRGWNPMFFSGPEYSFARVRAAVEDRYGAFRGAGRREQEKYPLNVRRPEDVSDPVEEGRSYTAADPTMAGDWFGLACLDGRQDELTPDEKLLAGQSLLDADRELALDLMYDASAAGSVEADFAIGMAMLDAGQSDDDWREAIPFVLRAAEAGNARAQYAAGYYFDRIERGTVAMVDWRAICRPGIPLLLDPDSPESRARVWYERAAAQDVVQARQRLRELGFCDAPPEEEG